MTSGPAPPKLRTVGLTKDFVTRPGPLRVLDRIDVSVGDGEFVCMVGSSGCGKSTLLAIAAGLEQATEGEVLLDGAPVTGPGAHCGLVFQSFSLYPWRTVAENVAFGLEIAGLDRAARRKRVADYLDVMELSAFADALPGQLSGGMKQRTAIARALATEPEVLLLDEPFGALDAQTRGSMQELILGVWRTLGTSILMVTHDVEEAVLLSNRVYVLSPRPGRVAAELDIRLPDPRHRSMLRDPEFQSLCHRVDDLLGETMQAEPTPSG
ncbi:MAG TPA: ABC transporter ATP-binding protein [Acidimicrobiales bacterium]|nr:ABC transporter ATP-binding protein [Acidimicrobiales bacterium]